MRRLSRVPLTPLLALLILAGCSGPVADPVRAQDDIAAPQRIDHSGFTRLLGRYVNDRGLVDYRSLKANQDTALTPYLRMLAETNPKNLSRNERLAFWLNAYNALALKLVVDLYPVESIRDIKPSALPFVPKVNSPFKLEVGEVAGAVRTLDEIEHDIIRERFEEPRIHFALVCAAMSCPPLRQEAYVGARLDRQLDDQARAFLHNDQKNQIPAGDNTIRVSSIFKWFGGDFGGTEQSIQQFLADYFEGEVAQTLRQGGYSVEYMDYDWSLNDQAHADEGQASR